MMMIGVEDCTLGSSTLHSLFFSFFLCLPGDETLDIFIDRCNDLFRNDPLDEYHDALQRPKMRTFSSNSLR